jgi:hypothetical protein
LQGRPRDWSPATPIRSRSRRNLLIGIGVVVALVAVGALAQHKSSPSNNVTNGPGFLTFPTFSTPPTGDPNNAARTCKPSFPGEMPTDICAAWGNPATFANVTINAGLLRIVPTSFGSLQACSDVSYVNGGAALATFGETQWQLGVVTSSGVVEEIGTPTEGTLGSGAQLAQGGHARGSICRDLDTTNPRHGTFILTCLPDSPDPNVRAVRLVWRANL